MPAKNLGLLSPDEYAEIKRAHGTLKSRKERIKKEIEEHKDAIASLEADLASIEAAEGFYTNRVAAEIAEYERAHGK